MCKENRHKRYLPQCSITQVTNHSSLIIILFIDQRPLQPRYNFVWDIQLVFDYRYLKKPLCKYIRIRTFSGPYFPAFRLDTVIYRPPHSFRMQENTDQKTSNMGTFYA